MRSAEDPLGDYEPGEKPGILSDRGRTLRVLRAHPRTKSIFVAQTPELAGTVARFELILEHDPFSRAAIHIVDQVQETLTALTQVPDSFWHGARFAMTGTTAAIRDLRNVTRRDNIKIQILVVLAVFSVLLLLLRRPVVCLYMMATVLFSYYVTMGITTLVFMGAYGDSYQGLDWKVPLFLFVILVAVGQDYNVYLATRVFEEQARIGPFAGLRRAVVQTGGIITSCGVIMAGTFISMTSAAWPTLLPGRWSEHFDVLNRARAEHVGNGLCLSLGGAARHDRGASDPGSILPGDRVPLANRPGASAQKLASNCLHIRHAEASGTTKWRPTINHKPLSNKQLRRLLAKSVADWRRDCLVTADGPVAGMLHVVVER